MKTTQKLGIPTAGHERDEGRRRRSDESRVARFGFENGEEKFESSSTPATDLRVEGWWKAVGG